MVEFPSPVQGDPITVSATLFSRFRQCPASAGAHLDGIYSPDTPQAFRGQLAHAIFRRHFEQGGIEDIEDACRREIGAGLNSKMSSSGVATPSALRSVIAEVGALYERFKGLAHPTMREAEVVLEYEPEVGVVLRGRVDAVFVDGEETRLVDWKTGSLGDPDDQMGFYALLWEMANGTIPGAVEAISLLTGERYLARPSLQDLSNTAAEVSRLITEVRQHWANGVPLSVRGGPWCRYCPILEGCSEGGAAMMILDGRFDG